VYFKDIIGQGPVVRRLLDEIHNGRVAHAQMFCGPSGNGGFAMALAYARYLLCDHPQEEDSCGECQSCHLTDILGHPDLHFVFPIYNKKNRSADKPTYCDDYLPEWRSMIKENPYFDMEDWMAACGATTQQLTIYSNESESIINKLSLKSSQGGYKIMIIWLPEKFHPVCANKILKIVEEPYPKTVFLFVSEHPDAVLETIRSRTQRIDIPAIPQSEIERYLTDKMNILPAEARRQARICEGSMASALRSITGNVKDKEYLELFKQLMRMCYSRKVKELKAWSETVSAFGREGLKSFLTYCQRMVRENFIYNFHLPDLNYMNDDESEFATKFSPFINEKNVIGISEELSLAQSQIEQNANSKMVLFDMALKIIILIKNR